MARGVRATNDGLVRGVAGVGGSQPTHYFSNNESLVLAVIDCQADGILGSTAVNSVSCWTILST